MQGMLPVAAGIVRCTCNDTIFIFTMEGRITDNVFKVANKKPDIHIAWRLGKGRRLVR